MAYSQKALEKLFAGKGETADVAEPNAVKRETEPDAEGNTVTVSGKSVVELPVDELTDYPKQLFKPYTEDKLEKLACSIKENGIIYPLIVRSVDGAYQIVCGHNRRTAAKQSGFSAVPCIVEELTDDEADIRMVETNLQVRDGLLPSEKAFAYKLKLDALNHRGVTCGQTGQKSRDTISSEESGRQIQRYIRLTCLITPLLDLVDNKALQLVPAVELSFLSTGNQETVYNYFFVTRKLYIDEQLAKRLREQSQLADLTEERIEALLPKEQGRTVKQTSKFSIPTKPLKKLLPANALTKDVEQEILNVLIDYFRQKQAGERKEKTVE